MNVYAYVDANPVNRIDPDGLNPAAVRGAVVVGEVAGEGLILWCRANIALCMRTLGPPAIRVAKACKALTDALSGDDCDAEWEEAYRICEVELAKPNPNPCMTGGYRDVASCARGLVSERCGGNRVDRASSPRQPFTLRRRW